ncbi:uncharacterized protein LOC116424805 [Nomia melanderi]|uniref:uncharacterized protein LOC116424805 n=1 Tax=Nomia melanderi TaxID=2448451 RepID=UPI0013040766|nr:probable serine/threonine-protein kinase nek3 [Nomia melanderi]
MHKNINMCDLIDLNSPDRKDLLSCRLASPLIPVPIDTANSNYNNRTNNVNSVMTGKRESLENNPFDMVLHKTTEYNQKKNDPFEVTLEKALKAKCKKNAASRTYAVDFTDDYTPKKRTKNFQRLKMNKTLDESLINEELQQESLTTNKIFNENVVLELNELDALTDNLKTVDVSDNLLFSNNKNVAPTIEIQEANLSILNQSIMNDTLFDAERDIDNDNHIKLLTNLEEDTNNTSHIPSSVTLLKPPKFRRSFSQPENVTSVMSEYSHRLSIVETIQTEHESKNSLSPSLHFLNEGFLKSYSGSSMFTSSSSISSIARVNSISPITNTSIALSNGTFNRAFLESFSSEKSDTTTLNKKLSPTKEVNSVLSTTKNLGTSVVNISKRTRSSISDLTDRLNKLKAKASELHVLEDNTNKENETSPSSSNNVKDCVKNVIEQAEECDMNNRLIDVDIFSPETNYSADQYKSSISDTSSDSVFLDGNKVNKSILHEAKLLARTFEEMALRTSSGSSIDDLITNNPLWTSELLPAFDDEVDNLIELPTSPNTNNANLNCREVSSSKDSVSYTNEKFVANKSMDNVKDLEMELIDPIPTEKRITAASLVLDLKKLINTENNTEANKLLENLEKVLGINWESNTELLTTYLNLTNNLAKSPLRSSNNLEMKNVAENNMEYSQEDNITSELSENIKESAFSVNMNINDSSIDKCSTSGEKCFKKIHSETKKSSEELKISNEKINNENKEDITAQNSNKEDAACKTENTNSLNEKMVMELLVHLGKLLTGQAKEQSTVNLFHNFEKALNLVSNNCNENTKTNNNELEVQQISEKSKLKHENKTQSSALSKSTNRWSLDLESKKQPISKSFMRKSISVSQTAPVKIVPSPVMLNGKSTIQLKEVTKRFSSDPGFISPMTNKKVTSNNNKHDSEKIAEIKTVVTSNFEKEKPTIVNTVKTKLKKNVSVDVINKRGPMKAILPIGSMQKRESINRRIVSSTETITPPKAHKIISSTPNSVNNKYSVKKSARSSKPVASSTPDACNSKTRKIPSQISSNANKRNFGCDISPVTTRVDINNSNGVNCSPKSKLPSSKRTTPKRRSADSSIPRSQTPPINKKLNSSFDVNQYERLTESPQRSIYKVSNTQKNSPVSLKKNGNNMQQSPLRDSNKLMHKVKPINLISKLRRHSVGNLTEKENNYI